MLYLSVKDTLLNISIEQLSFLPSLPLLTGGFDGQMLTEDVKYIFILVKSYYIIVSNILHKRQYNSIRWLFELSIYTNILHIYPYAN